MLRSGFPDTAARERVKISGVCAGKRGDAIEEISQKCGVAFTHTHKRGDQRRAKNSDASGWERVRKSGSEASHIDRCTNTHTHKIQVCAWALWTTAGDIVAYRWILVLRPLSRTLFPESKNRGLRKIKVSHLASPGCPVKNVLIKCKVPYPTLPH